MKKRFNNQSGMWIFIHTLLIPGIIHMHVSERMYDFVAAARLNYC